MAALLSTLLPVHRYGVFHGFVALGVLLTVLISQYGFGLHPCTLCVWQRYPYAGLLVVGFGMYVLACRRRSLTIAAVLIALFWLASLGLSLFHVGVENGWWEFHSACSGTIYTPGASAEDLLAKLKHAPVTRCDQSMPFLFGHSMARWNALLSCGMSLLSLGYLQNFSTRRRSR